MSYDPSNVPAAAGVGIFFCPAPECRRPHVMLYDADKQPIAHFVVPEGTFVTKLLEAIDRGAP